MPYREEEESKECDSVTPTKMAICADCIFKSEESSLEDFEDGKAITRPCIGSDELCLADYGGRHPVTGKKSGMSHLEKNKKTKQKHWIPLEHAVICKKRNPSGRCDRFVPASKIKKALIWIGKWIKGENNE